MKRNREKGEREKKKKASELRVIFFEEVDTI